MPGKVVEVEIRLLGPVEVTTADGPATPRGLRQKALLARLALEPGTPVPVERLIDDLWGEQLPDRPGSALQIVVARTRTALGPAESMLVTRAPGYALDVPAEAVDAGRFETLLAEARRSDRGGDVRTAVDILRSADSLWRGPALADLGDAPFHASASTRLNELRWSAFQRRVELDLALGNLDGLVAELRTVLAEQPLHEGLWAALMTALYRSGRQGDALRAYHDARGILRSELGVEPGPELRRVERLVLEHDPALHAVSEPHATQQAPLMVGRRTEIQRFRRLWDDHGTEPARLLVVTGDAGIGKSRFVLELTQVAAAAGARVLTGRCDREGVVPFQPVVHALQQWLDQVSVSVAAERLGAHAHRLGTLLPGLAAHLPGSRPQPGPPDDSGVERYLLFEAIAAALALASPPSGLLVVVEDVHWADHDTLLLLQHILRHQSMRHLLVVATSRTADALTEVPAAIRTRIDLPPLREPEIAELLAAAKGGRPELASLVAHRTGGNAFFVQQAIHHFAELGWDPAGEDDLGLTDDVADFVRRRLSPLAEPAQRALLLGAVLGSRFDLSVLAAVTDLAEDTLVGGLEAALRAGFVEEVDRRPGRYTFTHVLVRDAIYRDISGTRRALLHRQVAETLGAARGLLPDDEHDAVLARHLLAAGALGAPGQANAAARRAGKGAVAALAFSDAATWFERGLEALDWHHSPSDTARIDTLVELSDARGRAGANAGAAEAAREAAMLAAHVGDGERLAIAVLAVEEACWRTGTDDPALPALFDQALASVPETSAHLRARLLAQFYRGRWRQRPPSLALRAREARVLAERLGDPRLELLSRAVLYAAEYRVADVAERRVEAERIIELAVSSGVRELEINPGRGFLTECLMQSGDMSGVDAQIEALYDAGAALRQPGYQFIGPMAAAMRALHVGQFRRAEQQIDEAWASGMSRMGRAGHTYHTMALLILRAEQGRLDELAGDLRELGRDGPLAPAFRSALGWLHAQCGRSEEAGRLLATVVPEGIPEDWHWRFVTVALAAETSARLGDVARAAFLEAELAPLASYVVLCEPALFSLGSARRPLAAVQAAQGRSSEAVRTYEEALAHNEQLGALPWVAHTCTELASTLMARGAEGDAARAEQLLDRAAGLAEDLSMPVLAGRVRTLRRDRALGHRAEGDLKASGPTVEP